MVLIIFQVLDILFKDFCKLKLDYEFLRYKLGSLELFFLSLQVIIYVQLQY